MHLNKARARALIYRHMKTVLECRLCLSARKCLAMSSFCTHLDTYVLWLDKHKYLEW